MVPGLIAGAVGALVAVLLSLPLQSPDDIFFNSLTVGLGGAVLALVAGAAWNAVQRSQNAVRTFELAIGAGFVLVVLAALGLETQLARSFSYIAPIAAVDFGAIAILTPMLAQRAIPMWAGAVAVVLPLALGAALMGQRDTQTAALALPQLDLDGRHDSHEHDRERHHHRRRYHDPVELCHSRRDHRSIGCRDEDHRRREGRDLRRLGRLGLTVRGAREDRAAPAPERRDHEEHRGDWQRLPRRPRHDREPRYVEVQ